MLPNLDIDFQMKLGTKKKKKKSTFPKCFVLHFKAIFGLHFDWKLAVLYISQGEKHTSFLDLDVKTLMFLFLGDVVGPRK